MGNKQGSTDFSAWISELRVYNRFMWKKADFLDVRVGQWLEVDSFAMSLEKPCRVQVFCEMCSKFPSGHFDLAKDQSPSSAKASSKFHATGYSDCGRNGSTGPLPRLCNMNKL